MLLIVLKNGGDWDHLPWIIRCKDLNLEIIMYTLIDINGDVVYEEMLTTVEDHYTIKTLVP